MSTIVRALDQVLNPFSQWHIPPGDRTGMAPSDAPTPSPRPPRAGHRLELLFVLSERPRRVHYKEACPPYAQVDAVLFAERPDRRAMVVYLRGQTVVVDPAAQYGPGEFGGYWELDGPQPLPPDPVPADPDPVACRDPRGPA